MTAPDDHAATKPTATKPTATTPTATEWAATVAVRVPRDDGDGLLESARRRLGAASDVDVDERTDLVGMEPQISATVVHLDVRIATPASIDDSTVEARLAEAPGVQHVEGLRPA